MGREPVLIAVLAGGLWASAAPGQPQGQDGPVVVGDRRDKWKAFELRSMKADFEFLGQYRNDRLRQSGQDTIVERESLLRESLNLSSEASIGHKNLIDLFGSVQFGLDNRTFDGTTPGSESSDWTFLNLYDARALVLGSGRVPTTMYARREQNVFDQGFGGRVDQTMQEEGVIVQVQSDVAPTTLQYFHRRQEFDNAFDMGGGITTQDTFTGQSGIRINSNQHLDVNYTFDRVEEEQGGALFDSLDRHDANIVHTVGFGPEAHRHELRSSLRYFDQSGRFAQQDLRWDELLVLRHTDRLETRYSATVDDQSRTGQDQQFYRGEASIRHRLFDSLISTASAGAQRLSGPEGFTSDDTFASGHLDYTKRVPLGRLNASVGVTYNAQDNSDRGSPVSVTNEPQVFNDPLPIVLQRRNVVPGSIVLRPPSGFPPFVEGLDYTLRFFPDRVEVSIPVGSAIQSGQTVLANYVIGPEPGNQIDSLGTTTSARYSLTEGALRGASVYSMYRTLDQQVTAQDPNLFALDDFRDLLLGAEFERGGFDAKFEHERRWSDLTPFESDRIEAMYRLNLGRDSVASIEYSHDSIRYPLEHNRWDVDRITGRWVQRISPRLDFNARLEYRSENDRLRGDTEGFDQILGVNWHRGQTSIYFTVQNAFVNGPGFERTSQLFQLGLKRDF